MFTHLTGTFPLEFYKTSTCMQTVVCFSSTNNKLIIINKQQCIGVQKDIGLNLVGKTPKKISA